MDLTLTMPKEVFTYIKSDRTFVTEASTLEGNFNFYPNQQNAMKIQNTKTGNCCRFEFSNVTRRNGEIVSWVYKSRDGQMRAVVFND